MNLKYKAILFKVSSPTNVMRTDSFEGSYDKIPTVGERFYIQNDQPLTVPPPGQEPGRYLHTSIVDQVIMGDDGLTFTTRTGSVYNLRLK